MCIAVPDECSWHLWRRDLREMSNCITDIRIIHKFLNLTEGNWRNSIYIECKQCKYEAHEGCGDYLCVPDENGTPVLLPVSDCEILFARYIDPSECLLWISHYRFFEIFKAWINAKPLGTDTCPLRQKSVCPTDDF